MSPDPTSSGKSGTSTDTTAVPNSAELNAGVMVGEYRIEGQLGSGPTGRVHSAVHAAISRRAAIKVLRPDVASSRELVEKFFAEVRAANQLGHPNVVDIFAFGKLADGRNYVIMEWLRGESLRERTRRTRMPIAEGLAIISNVTLALAEAHDKGVVHRNLKPENIFLVEVKGERPLAKLLDFGTAELLGTKAEQRAATALPYISPEQARGEAVDGKTDIYALGAITYELVTGKPLFEGKNASDVIKKHLDDKPKAASSHNSEVPAQLDALIAAMLAKTPAERPSLEKIRSELRACRLLVGGALTPPAGVPIVPLSEADANAPTPASEAKADATDAKPAAAKAAKATAKQDTKAEAKPATATPKEPARPTAPQGSSGAWVAIIMLVLAAIGIGIWVYMNQREQTPVDTGAPADTPAEPTPTDPAAAPAAAPSDPAAGSAAPTGSGTPGSAAASPTAPTTSPAAPDPAAGATPPAPGSAAATPGSGTSTDSQRKQRRHRKDGSAATTDATKTPAPAPDPAPSPAPAP
jgi:serine/threonine-protein kinase